MKLASAFGGGMGRMGETCGVVSGAFMIISLTHGASEANDDHAKDKTCELVNKFAEEFKARNDTMLCRELIGITLGNKKLTAEAKKIISDRCPGYIKDAANIIEEII